IKIVFQIDEFAVDACPRIAVLEQCLHLFFELALAATNDRRHHHDTIFWRERHDALHNLIGGLAADGLSPFGTVWYPDRGVEKAKIVVNLSDGSDGRARTPAGGLLVDRNRWA